MTNKRAAVDLTLLAFCVACLIVTATDNQWFALHTTYITVMAVAVVVWSCALFLSWPKPAAGFESPYTHHTWRIGFGVFMMFVVFGVTGGILVHTYSDAHVSISLLAGCAGATLAALRTGIPTLISGITQPRQEYV